MIAYVNLGYNRYQYSFNHFMTATTTNSVVEATSLNIDAVYSSEVDRLYVLQTDPENSMIISKLGDLASNGLEMTIDIDTGSSNPMDYYEVYAKIGVFAD